MKLNLGAADRHLEGYISVDIQWPGIDDEHPGGHWPSTLEFERVDLSQIWPWPDSSVDEIQALDIIEHIADRIHFMNELHRVLKPGARVTIETPNAAKGAGFFQDPTHKSPWVMNSFQYFEHGSFAHQRFAKSYGITAAFKVISLSETSWQEKYENTWKIHAVLEAVK